MRPSRGSVSPERRWLDALAPVACRAWAVGVGALLAGCASILGLDEDATLIGDGGPDEPFPCALICDDGDACTVDRCVADGAGCRNDPVPDGPAPDAEQIEHDCARIVCEGGVGRHVSDDADLPLDEGCATGHCIAGVPTMTPRDRGVLCQSGFCDGAGNCFECLDDTHCADPETCGGGGDVGSCGCTPTTCTQLGLSCGTVPDGCQALLVCDTGTADIDETDIDCGGDVASCSRRCVVGRSCGYGTDCVSGLCGGGRCALPWSLSFGDALSQHAHALAVDTEGNVVAAGSFTGTIRFGGQDLTAPQGEVRAFLAKIDATGNNTWSMVFGDSGTVSIRDVVIDGAGNIVVVGSFVGTLVFGSAQLIGGPEPQAFVVKLDGAGLLLWARQLSTVSPGSGTSTALAVTVDGGSRVVVGGEVTGTVQIDATTLTSFDAADGLLLKLSPAGVLQFGKLFGRDGQQRITAVAAAPSTDIAIAGDFGGVVELQPNNPVASKGDWDAFAARLTASGAHVWSRTFGAPSDQLAVAVDIDAMDNVTVGGNFFGAFDSGLGSYPSAGAEDMFVASLKAMTGDTQWVGVYGGNLTDHLAALGQDPIGDTVIVGHFAGALHVGATTLVSLGGSDVLIAKLDTAGGIHWARRFGDVQTQIAVDVAAGTGGTITAFGDFRGSIDFGQGAMVSSGLDDVFLATMGPWP